jgi:uncharacterized protein YrrD
MLKGREIKGLAVYAGNKREEIGRVADIIAEKDGQVAALIIQSGGIISRALYAEMKNIKHITKKGVIIPNKAHLKKAPKNICPLNQNGWLGSKLYSSAGEDKGTVADILIKDGRVAGLEISVGLFGDLRRRRDFIPWQQVINKEGNFYENNS